MWVVALPDQRIWPLSGTVRCDSRAKAGRTEIVDKSLILLFCRLSIRHAQQQGGMNGYEYIFSQEGRKRVPPIAQDTNSRAQYCDGSGGAQANEGFRMNDPNLCFQPWPAGSDLSRGGLFMDAAVSPWFPFKVFNGVCNITIGASNPCLRQRPVEKFSSGPDQRPSFAVFMISRLLTNQHDSGRRFAVTEDCLRRIFPERAIPTASRRCPDFEQAAGCGD
jgi:hypothetical protein